MRSPELKDMSFLDLEDEPFKRMQLELDQVEIRYTKLETVVKGAARLLGDCKAENIGREIRKLKAEDSATLQARTEKLKLRVDEQQKMMAAQKEQIHKLQADWAGFEKIRLITEISGDVALKAHLYDEGKKMDAPLSNQKSVIILSKYVGRVEEALAEMRKIWPGHGSGTSKPSDPSPSQPSVSFLKPSDPYPALQPFVAPPPPPPKGMSPTISSLEALKARLQERRVQTALTTAAAIEVPPSSPLKFPSVTPEGTGKPESKATSSESNRKGKTVRKLPTEEDEVESLSSTGDEEDDEEEEEEEEPSTPSPERPSSRTRSASKKASPAAKPSTDRKRKPPAKSPKKGSSTKKGRKK